MSKILMIILLSNLCILQGCFVYGKKSKLTLDTVVKQKENLDSTLSSVNVSNNQIIINGTGFSKITSVKMKGNNLTADLNINSKSDSQIIATASSALSLLVGGTFDLIIGTVEAQSTYSINFTLQNGAVTANHLSSMGAEVGQVLKFDGTAWGPSNFSSSQLYRGTYDALSNTPNLGTTTPVAGDYFIVIVEGIYNGILYPVNSWIMFNGTDWEKISNTAAVVSSFKGRRGLVVPMKGDYNLGQMTDVDLTGAGIPATDKVLTYDASGKWIAKTLSAVGAGSVTTVSGTVPISVATGSSTPVISISQATASADGYLSSTDWTTFNNKVTSVNGSTGGVVLTTTNIAEGTNLYFDNARVLGGQLTGVDNTLAGSIASTDNILQAFGKTQNQINSLTTGGSNYLIKNAVDTITGQTTVHVTTGSFLLPRTPGDAELTAAANVNYVKTYADTKLPLAGGVMTGDLQINTQIKYKDVASNTVVIKAPATITNSYVLTLPTAVGVANQVLTTDASGVLSWTTPSTTAAPSGSAGGDLTGTYPNPAIGAGKVTLTHLSATGTKNNTTYLRGDNIWSILQTDVQALLLSAYTLGANAVVSSGDSIVVAFGKLQKQISDLAVSAVGGDLSGSLPNLTVAKIQGTAVSATAPSNGQFLKYVTGAPSNWVGSMVTVGDLKSSALGNLFPGTGCASNQTLYYSVVGDAFSCADIGTLDASKITTGTIATARLPVSATSWGAVTGGINYASGNVGIGTTAPTAQLHLVKADSSALTDFLINPTVKTSGNLLELQVGGSTKAFINRVGVIYGVWLQAAATGEIQWAGRGKLTSPAAGSIQLGAIDAAAPVAQTLSAQSVVAGTTDTSGTDLVIQGSRGTGTGAGGKINFNVAPAGTTGTAQNSAITKMVIDSSGNVGIGTTAPTQKLQVVGGRTYLEDTGGIPLALRGSGGAYTLFTSDASGTMSIQNAAANIKILSTTQTGNVGIGTASPSSPLQLSYTNTTTSGTNYGFQIKPTYNQVASTAGNTDLLINRTETSVGSGNQKLIDAQVGGISKFSVTNNGVISALSLSTNGNISGVNLNMSSLYSNNGWNSSGWVVVDVGAGNTYPIMNWIKGGVSKVIIDSAGSVGIGTGSPGAKLQVGTLADGSVALANAWNLLSDERLKRDFEIIPDSLEKLLSLNGYYYYWNRGSDHSKKIGVKAQEVEKVFPEVISKGADGFLSVSYNHLVAAVIEAVKEFYAKWFEDSKAIHRKMAKLETENINLKKENDAMKARLDKIEKTINSKQ